MSGDTSGPMAIALQAALKRGVNIGFVSTSQGSKLKAHCCECESCPMLAICPQRFYLRREALSETG